MEELKRRPEGNFDLSGNRREIHVSDRIGFKRCRRKWNWQSRLREKMQPKGESAAPLWYGSGFHFALEDRHGYRRFPDSYSAFLAYAKATDKETRPSDGMELLELAKGMFEHYEGWLSTRDEFQTFYVDGVPQLEIPFDIYLGTLSFNISGVPVVYEIWDSGTFDGMCTDSAGRLWIKEYKTAKQFDTNKLETDPQITAYCLAAQAHYGIPVEGVVYFQFLKDLAEAPLILKKGGVSVNKQQRTTHRLYRQTLIDVYGTVQDAPAENITFLNSLAEQESPEGDRFIRRDLVRRNQTQIANEHTRILEEAADMLDPKLRLYPNQTRDCIWDCPFREACIAMDDGSDYKFIIENNFELRKDITDNWRSRIQWPQTIV